jgi:hypothetical protein
MEKCCTNNCECNHKSESELAEDCKKTIEDLIENCRLELDRLTIGKGKYVSKLNLVGKDWTMSSPEKETDSDVLFRKLLYYFEVLYDQSLKITGEKRYYISFM